MRRLARLALVANLMGIAVVGFIAGAQVAAGHSVGWWALALAAGHALLLAPTMHTGPLPPEPDEVGR